MVVVVVVLVVVLVVVVVVGDETQMVLKHQLFLRLQPTNGEGQDWVCRFKSDV